MSGAEASATNSVALGTSATANIANSVALGSGSTTTAPSGNSFLTNVVAVPANGVVSVGSATANRRIQNVAGGSAATDAVNVAQLTEQNTRTNRQGIDTAAALGGNSAYDAATGAVSLPSYSVGGATVTNVGAAITNLDGRTTTNTTNIASNTSNITSLQNQTFRLSANNDASTAVASGDTVTFLDGNNVNITRSGNNVTIGTSLTPTFTTVTSTGAMNAGSLNVTGVSNLNGGADLNNTKITSVANGTNPGDAVNFSQLTTTNNNVTNAQTSANNAQTTATNAQTAAGNAQTTATTALNRANQGFNISADNGITDNVQLGETVDFTNTDGNLVATVSDNGINYDLAENIDLGVNGSVTTGNTVTNNAGVRIDDGTNITAVTATGTNVTDGTNTSNYDANGLVATNGSGSTGNYNAGSMTLTDAGNYNESTAGSNVISNNTGNANINTATFSAMFDSAGNTNFSTAAENTMSSGTNLTRASAAGTNVTDGTNTSNYGANGFTATDVDGNNGIAINQGGINFIDNVGAATGPSITATGIDAGNTVITGVADGVVATDAATLGQLNAASAEADAKTDALGTSTADNLGGNATYNAVTGAVSAPLNTLDDGTNTGTTNDFNNVGDALGNLDGRTTSNTAAIESGFNISADNGPTDNVQLGETVDFTNTDGNLVATVSDNGINYDLAETIDLGVNGSVTTGNTVTNNAGVAIDDGAGNATTITTAGTNVVDAAGNEADYTAAGTNVTDGNGNTGNYGAATTVLTDDSGNTNASAAIGNVIFDDAGNFNASGAIGNAIFDDAGNSNLSGAQGNIIRDDADNITTTTAAGTNVTDGTNTSNYGANGFTATDVDGNNGIAINQGGINFIDNVGAATGPSITATGIDAGNTVITGVADGVVATDAATKGQLDLVSNGLTDLTAGAVQYERDPNDNSIINYDRVTLAGTTAVIDQDEDGNEFVVSGGTRLSNVANGIEAADAVNKGQLDSLIAKNVTDVEVTDQNGNPVTVNITDQIVNRNVDNSSMDSLFLTYDVEGQDVTDRLTIGETVQKMNTEGVKFAHTNAVSAQGDIGITNDSSAGGDNSTAIGVNAIIQEGADNTVALGRNTLATNMATNSVVIGNDSQVAGESSIAIGDGAQALGNQSISIGTGNIVNGDNSGAFGDPSIINGDSSYSVGNNNIIDSNDTFVLGNNVTSTVEGSVVLGTGSAARTGAGIAGYLSAGNAAITATTSTTGAVAVGDAANGVYRQVTGVAAGTADSDAVNVSQLKAVSDTLQNNNEALSNAAVQYDKNPDDTINKGSITLGGGAAGTTITNVSGGAINASSTDAINGSQLYNLGNDVAGVIGGNAAVDNDGNLTVSNIGGTGADNLNDAIAAVNNGNAQANENIQANTDRLDAGLSFGADSGATISKPIGDTTALTFEGGNNITTTATSSGIKFDLNGNIDVDNITADTVTTGNTTVSSTGVTIKDGPSMTTAGINAGGKTITGVADGIEVNDAVNLGQLSALDNKLSNSVNELGYKINEVEDDANAGISAAMAMSSLPQAYIPGKSMVGGGIATYNGQSAVAIGLSKVSDNGRWVIKVNGTADTQGNAGGAVGAGFHF